MGVWADIGDVGFSRAMLFKCLTNPFLVGGLFFASGMFLLPCMLYCCGFDGCISHNRKIPIVMSVELQCAPVYVGDFLALRLCLGNHVGIVVILTDIRVPCAQRCSNAPLLVF